MIETLRKIVCFGFGATALFLLACGCGNAADAIAKCQNNLKQLGAALKDYSKASMGECFPRLSSRPGCLMFTNEGIGTDPVYPKYLTDLDLLICPASREPGLLKDPAKRSDPNVMMDDYSYFYLGYAVTNDADVTAFAEAYRERIKKGLKFDQDLITPNGTLHLLREGVERRYIPDLGNPDGPAIAQAKLPVLIERPGNHTPEGGNVLYMDGHVEFLPYGESGRWPMTKATIETLEALDALKSPTE